MICLRSNFMVFSCLLILLFSNLLEAELAVTCIKNDTISTFTRDVKLRGISYQKTSISEDSEASAVFNISIDTVQDYILRWERDDQEITDSVVNYTTGVPANPAELYMMESRSDGTINVTLVLRKRRLIPGLYKLIITNGETHASAVAEFRAPPMLPEFSKAKTHLPGDRLSILCQVTGYPLPPRVNWSFAPVKRESMRDFPTLSDAESNLKPLEESENASYLFLKNDVENDQLVFEELPEEYGGLYQCEVSLDGHQDKSLILVHIKDRYAAIWPFIGIVIEVTVLVIGILLYERHQMRSRAAAKNETPAAPLDVSPKPDPQMTTMGVAPQQNNVLTTAEPPVEHLPHGDHRSSGPEAGDDVRLRTVAHC